MKGYSCEPYAAVRAWSTNPTPVSFARRPRWRHFVHVLILLCLCVTTAEAALPDACVDEVATGLLQDAPLHPGEQWGVEAVDRDHGPIGELPGDSTFPTRDHCSHPHGQGSLLALASGGMKPVPPSAAAAEQLRVPDSPVLEQRLRPPLR